MNTENASYFKGVQVACLQAYPRLVLIDQDTEKYEGLDVANFPPEIEREVEAYYQRYFREEMSVADMIIMLSRSKSSDNVQDRDFFACMLHYLFDEYRFLKNEYPQKAVEESGTLLGCIIGYDLVSYIPLGIALRYILEALQENTDSKMFQFGVKALAKFYTRVNQWPSYRSQILNLQHVSDAYPDLIEPIRSNVEVSDDPLDITKPKTTFASIRAPEEPENLDKTEPDDTIKDKVLFALNNLSSANVAAKVSGLKENLPCRFFYWFADHLVQQRALLEPNYHTLYLELLSNFKDSNLNNAILRKSYSTVVALINSKDIENSAMDRAHLRNLASWLGALTLGQNKPILHRYIAFKDILLEGHELNRLNLVIPFTREVLKHAANSKIFAPPNPWLMAIVRLLKEFYEFAELKINLQFEVECLCRELNLELSSIQPSTLLRELPDRRRLSEEAKMRPSGPPQAAPHSAQNDVERKEAMDTVGGQISLASQIVISEEADIFNRHAGLKRVLALAIDSAIREVMPPVTDRSVIIAGISTRDFVTKDFSLDGNEERMRRAAHGMVQALAGHLTLATCREPLRASLVSTLRNYLLQNGYAEQTLPEAAINTVVADNLNLASAIVAKAGQERAIQKIDEMLAPSYAARRRHRDLRIVQPYVDPNASRYSLRFADPLRLRANGLTAQQLSVYEEFLHAQPVAANFTNELLQDSAQGNAPMPAAREAQLGGASSVANVDGIIGDFMDLAAIARESQYTSINMIPADHEIKLLLNHIPNVAAMLEMRDELVGELAQRACLIIFSPKEPRLVMETFSFLLVRLCSVSPRTAKNVIGWLLSAEDERLYNIPATLALMQAGLITPADMDIKLSNLILSRSKSALEFTEILIRQIISAPVPMASKADFRRCFEASKSIGQDDSAGGLYKNMEPNGVGTDLSLTLDAQSYEMSELAEQLVHILYQWTRLVGPHNATDVDRIAFILQLEQSEILKDEAMSLLFFRTGIEHGVNMYIKHNSTGLKSSTEPYNDD